jgi:anti-sigma factor RsiW
LQCDAVKKQLNAFIDEEVSRTISCEIERHLQVCAACSSLVHRMRRLDDVLDNTPALPVPAGFSQRMMSAARRQLLKEVQTVTIPPMAAPPRRRRVTLRDGIAAAVLMFGLSLGSWMASQTWRFDEPSDELTNTALRNSRDIDRFYGAGSEGFDAQRPLVQVYMAVVDRNLLGE